MAYLTEVRNVYEHFSIKKYWYIIFGNFAFAVLCFHTLLCVNKYPRLTRKKVRRNFFFLGIIVIGIPTLIVDIITDGTESLLFNSLPILCFYLTGIYATYRHALWREEHMVKY